MSTFIKPASSDDQRLSAPQCDGLTPVQTLHENPWFTVRNRGGFFTTEYAQHQVIVLPVVDDRSVVMVRVARPVIADATVELPAGGIHMDETPAMGAARELYEETGIQADVERFTPLVPIANSPNRNPHLIHIYRIDLTFDEYLHRGEHDDEIDAVMLCSYGDIAGMIMKGQIFVGVPLAILGRFLLEKSIGHEHGQPAFSSRIVVGAKNRCC